MVKVKFFGVLSGMMPEKDEGGYWKLDACDRTIEEVLALTSVKNTITRYSTFVNNERKNIDYVLKDGDILTVLPLLAGG